MPPRRQAAKESSSARKGPNCPKLVKMEGEKGKEDTGKDKEPPQDEVGAKNTSGPEPETPKTEVGKGATFSFTLKKKKKPLPTPETSEEDEQQSKCGVIDLIPTPAKSEISGATPAKSEKSGATRVLVKKVPIINLTQHTEDELAQWIKAHPILWDKTLNLYRNRQKKTDMWAEKAATLNLTKEELFAWYYSLRTLFARLLSKSGDASNPFSFETDRERWILENFQFLKDTVTRHPSNQLARTVSSIFLTFCHLKLL